MHAPMCTCTRRETSLDGKTAIRPSRVAVSRKGDDALQQGPQARKVVVVLRPAVVQAADRVASAAATPGAAAAGRVAAAVLNFAAQAGTDEPTMADTPAKVPTDISWQGRACTSSS